MSEWEYSFTVTQLDYFDKVMFFQITVEGDVRFQILIYFLQLGGNPVEIALVIWDGILNSCGLWGLNGMDSAKLKRP